jgi:hypothetical protein
MSVDFFCTRCCHTTRAQEFGLCDDNVYKTTAYLDTTNKNKWVAIIKNPNAYLVDFQAIDWCECVKIFEPNGDMAKRCDAMLIYENTLIFVELKQRDAPNSKWIPQGCEQLISAIKHFKIHHPMPPDFSIKQKAYLVNSLKPNFPSNQMHTTQKFYNDSGGIILAIQQKIDL